VAALQASIPQFWRICNPPASNISICNARHLCSNKFSIIFAPKISMLWEDVIHISGIANPHIQDLRIANPLGRGKKETVTMLWPSLFLKLNNV
jgi:hypothetical protein